MTYEDIDIINKKAELRKDGVYSFKDNIWVCKDGKFIAYADPFGYCLKRMGAFNVQIGKVDRYDRRKKLLEYLKSI